MRKLSEQHKIPARSLPEIVGRYDGLISRQQTVVGRKFNDRKVPAEAVTNAIVLHFLGLPEAEQDAILGRHLPELAGLMGIDAGPTDSGAATEYAAGSDVLDPPGARKGRAG